MSAGRGGASPSLGDAFLLGMVASVATALTGLGKAKVAAWYLGPEGVGLLAEVNQAVQLAFVPVTMIAGPALVTGVSRAVAAGDHARAGWLQRAALGALALSGGLGVLAAIGLARLSPPAGAEGSVDDLVVLAAVAALVGAVAMVHRQVLVGGTRLRAVTGVGLAESLVLLLAVAVGTAVGGVAGHLVGALVAALLVLPAWSVVVARGGADYRPGVRLDPAFLGETARLGLSSLVAGTALHGALWLIRGALGGAGGEEGDAWNGYFQAAWSVGTMYLTLVLNGLSSFVFPRYAAAEDEAALAREIEAASAFVLRVTPPVVLLAVALRVPLLHALYSAEFRPAATLFGLLLAGDMAKVLAWCQGGVLLYRGHAAASALVASTVWVLFGGLAWWGVGRWGLDAVGAAYALAFVAQVGVTGLGLWWVTGIRPSFRYMAQAVGLVSATVVAVLWTAQAPWASWLVGAVGMGLAARAGLIRAGWLRVQAVLRRLSAR